MIEGIEGNPSALSYTNDDGRKPLLSAARSCHSIKYLCILAKKGIKPNADGGGMRGELSVSNSELAFNVLQLLV